MTKITKLEIEHVSNTYKLGFKGDLKMGEYKFTSKDGCCPTCNTFCRIWYIQDKNIGGGKYKYCLMSKPDELPNERIFESKNGVAAWLNGCGKDVKIEDDVADFIISRDSVQGYIFSDRMLLSHEGKEYIYDKSKNSIRELRETRQETGWFDEYLECLRMAKSVLEKQEGQMSLFG